MARNKAECEQVAQGNTIKDQEHKSLYSVIPSVRDTDRNTWCYKQQKKPFNSQHKLWPCKSAYCTTRLRTKCFHHDCIKIALNSDVPFYNKEENLSLITNFIKTTSWWGMLILKQLGLLRGVEKQVVLLSMVRCYCLSTKGKVAIILMQQLPKLL